MKKIILSTAVVLFAFSGFNVNAKETMTPLNNIEIVGNYEISAFCKLIQMGDYDAVKALINSGENVNKRSNGLTPLMFAARHNKAKIAQLLIDNGAKIKVKSQKNNMTALDFAKRSKAADAYKVIKEAMGK